MTSTYHYIIQPKRKHCLVLPHVPAAHFLRSSALSTRTLGAVAVVSVLMAGFVPYEAYADAGLGEIGKVNVVHGNADFNYLTRDNLQVTAGNGTIVHTDGLSVGDGQRLGIDSPSLLWRVTGGQPSQILGQVDATGAFMLVNSAGVFFGKNSQVNVSSLVVSTADISNENFHADHLKFDRPGRPDASIINRGTITAKEGGLVALLAPGVENTGVISAKMGTVVIGAGEAFTLDFYGDNLYSFGVDKAAEAKAKDENGKELDDAITNSGSLKAGRIYMTANSAKNVVDHAINTTGIVEATDVHFDGGDIVLDGGEGDVRVAGQVKASGKKGGKITVLAKNDITLASDAVVDASGDRQGGTIRIGGDKRGGGTLARAKTVQADKGAVINASATHGDAGDVVVWSDRNTNFSGLINIGSIHGNGGHAEVSSRETLTYRGFTDGQGVSLGTLLLDPGNWTISSAATDGNHYNNTELSTQLNSANVTIDTTTATPQPGDLGDINVQDAVAWTGKGTLSLAAQNDINVNAPIISGYNGGVSSTEGGLVINAGRDINVSKTIVTNTGLVDGRSIRGFNLIGNAQINSGKGDIYLSAFDTGFHSDSKNSINTGGNVLLDIGRGLIQNANDALGNIGGKSDIFLSSITYNENVVLDTSNLTLYTNPFSLASVSGIENKGQAGTIAIAAGTKNVHIGSVAGGNAQGFKVVGVTNGKAGIANAAITFLGDNGGSSVQAMNISSTGKTSGIIIVNNNQGGQITIGDGNAIGGNTIQQVGADGVRIIGSSNVRVFNNTVDTTANAGIYGLNSSNISVINNKVSNAGGKTTGGIVFTGGGTISITSNKVNGTALNGILLSQATGKNVINSNTVDGAAVHGIVVNQITGSADFSQGVRVENNLIGFTKGNNNGSGIGVTRSTYVQIVNNFVANFHGGVNVNTGSVGAVVAGNAINLPVDAVGIIIDTSSNNSQLSGNTISGNTGTVGISISRSTGVVSTNDQAFNNLVGMRVSNAQGIALNGANLSGNVVGIYGLNGATITVSNTGISSATTGIFLENAGTTLSFTDNNSRMANSVGTYFRLGKGAMAGQTLDASQQFFNGTRGVDMSDAQFAAARAKTVDSETDPAVGFVFYRPAPVVPPVIVPPVAAAGLDQDLLDQLLQRDFDPRRDVFSYSGKTIESTYTLSPYNFTVETLNLSLLSPNAGGPTAPVTPGAVDLGSLAPAAGGNNDSPTGTALASLAPSASSAGVEGCGNSFLGNGLSDGNCGTPAQ